MTCVQMADLVFCIKLKSIGRTVAVTLRKW